jgi:hypothetical protein
MSLFIIVAKNSVFIYISCLEYDTISLLFGYLEKLPIKVNIHKTF